ncbi:MAG: glycosyltransferase family 39 protein [Thermoanaerobaculia bacterium]
MAARTTRWALAAVLLLGGLLRFTALDYGLPRTDLGTDEQITRMRVLHGTDTGRLVTPKYNWPQLNIYASRTAIRVARWIESLLGVEAHNVLWIGRAYTAVLGMLTLGLVYLVGRRLFDPAVGVASAGLLAVMPLHANRSRLWVPDVPMTAAYALALLAAVWALERPSWRRFALAGVAIGLAAAFKYNGAGACLALVLAAAIAARAAGGLRSWAVALGRLTAAALTSIAVFVACDPPVVAQLDRLVHGVTWIGDIYTREPSTGPLGWHTMSYILRSFFAGGYEGVGAWTCLLAVFGLVLLALRRDRAAALAVVPGFLYLLGYSLVLRNPFERIFVPLLPHLALAAGYGTVVAARALARPVESPRLRAAVAGCLITMAVVAAAPQAMVHALAARGGDTRLDALAWMHDNVPVGASVLCEWDMVQPPHGRYYGGDKPPNLYNVSSDPAALAARWDYVIASSRTYEWVYRQRSRPGFDRRAAFYDALFDHPRFEEVARFTPGPRRYGPDLRVLRSRPPRGPSFPPDATTMRLEGWAWLSSRRLRSRSQPGAYRMWRPGDRITGRAVVDRPGCYELVLSTMAARPSELAVSLGSRSRTLRLHGAREVRLPAGLPAGQVWWRLDTASGRHRGGVIKLWDLRLKRLSSDPTAGRCSGGR